MNLSDTPTQLSFSARPGACDPEQLARLLGSVSEWNEWREANYEVPINLAGADLHGAALEGAMLAEADLTDADLSGAKLAGASFYKTLLGHANLSSADLTGADFNDAYLNWASLESALLNGAELADAQLHEADLQGADLTNTFLTRANLTLANLTGADLTEAYLEGAKFLKSNLMGANLSKCDLTHSSLVGAQIENARFSGSRIYGVSTWDVEGTPAAQDSLVISRMGEPEVTTDSLKVAQFIHLLLDNQELRDVIDTLGKKTVLILGRFGGGGIEILREIGSCLRDAGYLPVIFEFEKPKDKTYTETVRTLAGLARFVVVDLSVPSVPKELEATVPNVKIPYVPVIEKGKQPFSMFVDLLEYDWVLRPIFEFVGKDDLRKQFAERVISPEEKRVAIRQAKLAEIYGK